MSPLRDNLLIRPDAVKDRTTSGLYIKEDWETRPPIGTVEAVGPSVTDVVVGERVVFMRYGSVQTADKDLRLVKESHIMAKLDG
jgi:co-chaperonin GroES (HSP10)